MSGVTGVAQNKHIRPHADEYRRFCEIAPRMEFVKLTGSLAEGIIAALEEFDRLRGDGEQGQAVAHVLRIDTPQSALVGLYDDTLKVGEQLYTRPQPVAGDAVRTIEVLNTILSAFDGVPSPCEERDAIAIAIAALRVNGVPDALSAQPAPSAQGMDPPIEQQRDMLAKAIGDAAMKAGIWNGQAPITGPMLLMLCDDLANAAAPSEQVAASVAVPDALLREVSAELESVGCYACIGSMAGMEDLHGRIAAYLAAAPVAPEREVG